MFEITLQPYEYVENQSQLEQGATMLIPGPQAPQSSTICTGNARAGRATTARQRRALTNRTAGKRVGALPHRLPVLTGGTGRIPGGEPITIRLTSSGFYNSAVEIRSDRTRRTRNLRPLETLSPLPDESAGTGGR